MAGTVEATVQAVRAGEVIVTLEGRELDPIPMESIGITIDSTNRQILDAVRGSVLEMTGVDLRDEQEEYAFAVRKALNTGRIFIYPKPVAG